MKNKGFTLIELLSVIVVIAIVTLIAFPVISGVVEKTKLKALEDSAYGLVEASNLYYAQYQNNETKRFDKNEDENTLKNLSYKGSIEKGTVIINNKGQVTVCISDGKNSAYKNYNENKVTAVAKKTCTVPSNTYIVYLDDERTVKTYTTEELTEIVEELKEDNNTLKAKVNALENSSTTKDEIYPVGSIYMSMENTNPSTLFGGTWESIESGRMLQSTSTASGTTGGQTSISYTPSGTVNGHQLTVNEMPSHSHWVKSGGGDSWASGYTNATQGFGVNFVISPDRVNSGQWYTQNSNDNVCSGALCAWPTGGNQSHSHTFTGTQASIATMPPYITVYMWKRVS